MYFANNVIKVIVIVYWKFCHVESRILSAKYRSGWIEQRNFSKHVVQTGQTFPMKTNNTFQGPIIGIYLNVI